MQDEQIEHLPQDNEKEFIKEINYTINVKIIRKLNNKKYMKNIFKPFCKIVHNFAGCSDFETKISYNEKNNLMTQIRFTKS